MNTSTDVFSPNDASPALLASPVSSRYSDCHPPTPPPIPRHPSVLPDKKHLPLLFTCFQTGGANYSSAAAAAVEKTGLAFPANAGQQRGKHISGDYSAWETNRHRGAPRLYVSRF